MSGNRTRGSADPPPGSVGGERTRDDGGGVLALLDEGADLVLVLPPAPPGFHWPCIGFACVPASPVCRATMKAVGCGECRMRACCDLVERNARLIMQGKVSEERTAALAEDLRRYCPPEATYCQVARQPRRASAVGDRSRRRELRERRKALQSTAARVHPPKKAFEA